MGTEMTGWKILNYNSGIVSVNNKNTQFKLERGEINIPGGMFVYLNKQHALQDYLEKDCVLIEVNIDKGDILDTRINYECGMIEVFIKSCFINDWVKYG